MNVNKKLGRFKQWAGERMGGEIRTNTSDDFKALELEMGLRYDGIKSNHQAMNDYVKSMSQKTEGSNREKQLPITALGSIMQAHGEDFEQDSEFGQCLTAMGRTNEMLGRAQDTFVQKASTTWLDSLERSTAQHKELSKSRKKLEDRRLAFDTATAKLEKSKRDDFRTEEELRSQRAKYEEASEDVHRRMMDVKEMETDSVTDLTDFLDAQLAYFEKCRDILLQAKREWPAVSTAATQPSRLTRSRSNTGGSYTGSPYGRRFDTIEEHSSMPPPQPPRPGITTGSRNPSSSLPQSPARELSGFDFASRPGINRSSTYDGVRSVSPASSTYSGHRMASDNLSIRTTKSQLRSVSQSRYEDSPISETSSSRGDFMESAFANGITAAKKKPPPPPPPSRSTKPPPPLPPVRSRPLQDV